MIWKKPVGVIDIKRERWDCVRLFMQMRVYGDARE